MLTAGQECPQSIEIDTGGEVWAVAFTANSEYLVSGGRGGVRMWRTKDGKRVATMQAEYGARCVAVSRDGRFIAAGLDDVVVWDARNYGQVFTGEVGKTICDIDFSPDSTRLVSANGYNRTATIWHITIRKQAQILDHVQSVLAAKYSPRGDRIATASYTAVRVWDDNSGRLLVDVNVGLRPLHGLLWFNNHLFVTTRDNKIRQINASTGSTVSEWSVSGTLPSSIALPHHGRFIAYATSHNITLWDTLTHIELGLIPRSSEGRSATFSPSDQLLAVVQGRKIIINNLPFITLVKVRPHSSSLIYIHTRGL